MTTCVSGYWRIVNKHSDDNFSQWFETTLRVNCPYVFFGTKETIELAKKYRRELPTYYIELDVEQFHTYKYKDKMKTDPKHCPSQELNIIWNEKIFLIEKAKQLNIFKSDYFMWMDAAICSLRNTTHTKEPFPNEDKLSTIVKKHKFNFTSSDHPAFEPHRLGTYYHFVSGTFILHESIVDIALQLYRIYLEKYIEPTNLYTDQIIWTYIYNDFPDLFNQIGHGYGEIINLLK